MADWQVVFHPDKTFIGRISRGFNFWEYRFAPKDLWMVRVTVERMIEGISRFDERGAAASRIRDALAGG
ncbi:hypothetical protein [Laspinema olomoucense]|uniref:Uncharacterized protein n=1 Tax=Laspinema olomoucense D3b TaxID=2953688 RepID=A0ABT2NEQ9_9CYAN|nr:hypothetical protein [Laspinema sp. D3b]MCT7979820.1 hypothetical protein [Laspinema sp. D3b]